jgi:hypothetical protein
MEENLLPPLGDFVLRMRRFDHNACRIGVKVYVDPEIARKGGQLEFEADGWTVTPRGRTWMY